MVILTVWLLQVEDGDCKGTIIKTVGHAIQDNYRTENSDGQVKYRAREQPQVKGFREQSCLRELECQVAWGILEAKLYGGLKSTTCVRN